MIAHLARRLNWGNSRRHVATKIFYAIIELAEAGDVWKHRGDAKWLKEHYGIKSKKQLNAYMHEELIDAIFYCLHAIHCLNPSLDPDAEFIRKWNINAARKRHYIDDSSVTEELK